MFRNERGLFRFMSRLPLNSFLLDFYTDHPRFSEPLDYYAWSVLRFRLAG